MSNSIPIQRSSEEHKQLERDFNARRPMLTHVASAVKAEVEDLLNDEGFHVKLSQSVLTGKQFLELAQKSVSRQPLVEFTSQIHIRVVSQGTNDIEEIRETIKTHYQSVQEGWKADRSQLTLSFLIPPQAKPEGFRDRDDLPTQMQVSIAASQSEPRVTTDGEEIPNLALIMKGGGIKGLAYVGALDLLRDEYDFSWFVGTSAGAITAILLAAGYTVEELQKILEEKNFKDFFDAPLYILPTNLLFKKGMHPAQEFTDWMDRLLTKKFGGKLPVTLGQIQEATGNRITVYASQKGRKVLTFDSVDDSEVSGAYAARCSMSIPVIFTPQSDQGRWAFDGGLQNNFPIRQLTDDHGEVPFISLYLGSETYEPQKESSVILHVLGIFLSQGEDEFVDEYKEQTVIVDPRPVGTLDFDLVDEEKDYLVTCGKIGALKHLLPVAEHSSDSELAEAFENKASLKPIAVKMNRWRYFRGRGIAAILAIVFFSCLYFLLRWWFSIESLWDWWFGK